MRRAAFLLLLTLLPGLAAAQAFFTLKGHGGPVVGIAVAPDGRVATAGFDNAVGLWRGQVPRWFDGHAAAVNTVLFADGVLYSAGDDFTLRRWPDGVEIGHHEGKIVALCAVPGAIATASWDGRIGLWPLDGAEPRLLAGHAGGVNALVYAPDRKRMYSAGADGSIRAWAMPTGLQTEQITDHGFGVNVVIIDPDERWLAYGAVDGSTRVIDLETGDVIADLSLDRRPILAMALSPDGRQMAVGDGQGYIMLVDTKDWRITGDFRATLRGPIWALAFSAEGRHILAGGLDQAVYGWPAATLDQQEPMTTVTPEYLRDPAEMSNGERQFARKCSICHSLRPGSARRAGPTLYDLFGRIAGTVADYSYSAPLDGSDIVWNQDSIDALFDLGPDHYIPGSKMPMQRIANPEDRADLIAFLRQATAKKETRE